MREWIDKQYRGSKLKSDLRSTNASYRLYCGGDYIVSHCMLYKITLTLTPVHGRMMRVIFLFFLLAIEVAFWGTGKPSP